MSHLPPQSQPPKRRTSAGKALLIIFGSMLASTVGLIGVALLIGAVLPDADQPTAAQPQPAVTTSTAALPPARGPLSDDQRAYLRELALIDPGLSVHDERALRRAENTCYDILYGGMTGTALADRVVVRLSGGNATINQRQASEAIELMNRWICPAWKAEWASKYPSPKS